MPFIDRMGVIFLILSAIIYFISSRESKEDADPKAIITEKGSFYTNPVFNMSAIGIGIILIVLYSALW